MKRGLIAWDKNQLPPEAFEARLALARKNIAERELPALIVYSDLAKTDQARYFSNFMPYFNRALLVISGDSEPVLLCGLSPRVYPWIKSVTILGEIYHSPDPAKRFLQLCSERSWKKIGALDFDQFPYDLHTTIRAGIECVDVPWTTIRPTADRWEIPMYNRADKMAREILEQELPHRAAIGDRQLVGRLERKCRRAGAEDLVIQLSNGEIVLALEYRGHWVKVKTPL